MKKIRAVYIGDVRFDQCPVFELNQRTNYFEMLIDREYRYGKECVEEDDDFLIFEIENDRATLIDKNKFRRKDRYKRRRHSRKHAQS